MVEIKVDMKNREKLKQLHTATHIINYSAREVLGNHVWQNGSNLKSDIGSLDITHYDNLTLDEIFKIERLSNKVVFENKKVYIEELERGVAEKKYGFTLYQGGAIPMKTLRVVKIDDNDIEACGGIHMQSTRGIGLIKIVDSQKIADGVVRLKYVVGDFAINFIEEKQKIVRLASYVFSVDDNNLIKTGEKFFNEWKEQKKEIERLKENLKQSFTDQFIETSQEQFEIKGDYDMGFLMDIFTKVMVKKPKFKLSTGKFIIATKSFKVENYKKEINKGNFNIYII